MDTVPFDVLREIFDLVSDYKTFRGLWKVCKRWQRVYCHPLTLRNAFSTEEPFGRFISWRAGELGVGIVEGQTLPDGTRHGKQRAQRTDGTVTWETTMRNGKQHGTEFYYGQYGTLTRYCEWVHGRIQGIQADYIDVTGILRKVDLWDAKGITNTASKDGWNNRYMEFPPGSLAVLLAELEKRGLSTATISK